MLRYHRCLCACVCVIISFFLACIQEDSNLVSAYSSGGCYQLVSELNFSTLFLAFLVLCLYVCAYVCLCDTFDDRFFFSSFAIKKKYLLLFLQVMST